MSPKAEQSSAVVRKKAPASGVEKNQQLDIPKVHRSSKEMFGELEETVEYLKVLYYGKEGSAKTSNLATMAKMGRILVINAEGGFKKGPLLRLGIPIENIKVWPAKQGDPITIAGLDDVYDRIKADLDADPESWVGIGFDSATDIVQALTDEVSQHRITKANLGGSRIEGVDAYFTDVSDYGTMTKMFTDKLRKFRDLPVHVVYTALERRDVDKTSGEVMIGPAVTPGVATGLLGYVDLVLHCTAEDEENPFRALSKGSKLRRVKDRLGILPRVLANPTMDRIIQYANGEFDNEPDPMQDLIVERVPKKKVSRKTPPEALVPADAVTA